MRRFGSRVTMQVLQASVMGLHLGAICSRSFASTRRRWHSGASCRIHDKPAGSAIVSSLGPIRQVVQGEHDVQRRYFVIVPGTPNQLGTPVQVQGGTGTQPHRLIEYPR